MVFTTLLATLAVSAGDRLMEARTLSSQDWANLANEYMIMGEERAIAALVERSNRPQALGSRINFNIRTALMARLIFDPKNEPLRTPQVGVFPLPHRSMPLKDWPLYPFVKQNDVIFLMSEPVGSDKTETCEGYLRYLRQNGMFRRRLYAVPNEEQAKKALANLYESPLWNGLEWSFTGRGEAYRISPNTVKDYLAKQVKQQ